MTKAEYQREYYAKNIDKMREYRRKYYQEHKEKQQVWAKEYYKTHKEELNQWHHDYYQKNKDMVDAKSREYNAKNRKKVTKMVNARRKAVAEELKAKGMMYTFLPKTARTEANLGRIMDTYNIPREKAEEIWEFCAQDTRFILSHPEAVHDWIENRFDLPF